MASPCPFISSIYAIIPYNIIKIIFTSSHWVAKLTFLTICASKMNQSCSQKWSKVVQKLPKIEKVANRIERVAYQSELFYSKQHVKQHAVTYNMAADNGSVQFLMNNRWKFGAFFAGDIILITADLFVGAYQFLLSLHRSDKSLVYTYTAFLISNNCKSLVHWCVSYTSDCSFVAQTLLKTVKVAKKLPSTIYIGLPTIFFYTENWSIWFYGKKFLLNSNEKKMIDHHTRLLWQAHPPFFLPSVAGGMI